MERLTVKNTRSIENSNKAFALRRSLYEKYKEDKNLSFFFSDESDDAKTDKEIIKQVANSTICVKRRSITDMETDKKQLHV